MTAQIPFVRTCSVWRALEVVGDMPVLLIAEALWQGARRFTEIAGTTGLPRAVVANRLARLEAHGLVRRSPLSPAARHHGYRFARKGVETYPLALMALRWEQLWSKPASRPETPVPRLVHLSCGAAIVPMPACSACHEAIDARDIDFRPGPGLGWMPADYSRRRATVAAAPAAGRLAGAAAAILGDRWAMLVLRSLFTGTSRFGGIRTETGMATNVLADRLAGLAARGLLAQETDGQGRPRYRLTRAGLDFYPVILALMDWGDRWYASPEGPPVILSHRSCGEDMRLVILCPACGARLEPGDTRLVLGGLAEGVPAGGTPRQRA
jgi:DNA-binding HxlR family transcriptional regulator